MNLKDLEYLVALSECQNISKAADRLYITQPALSRFLACLEKDLGVKLFRKVSRKLIPTEAGEIYIHFAEETLKNREEVKQRVNRINESRTIRIGIPQNLTPLLVSSMAEFKRDNPDVKFELVEDIYPHISNAIHDGLLDLAFVGSEENAKTYHSEFFLNETIMVCLHNKYRMTPKVKGEVPYLLISDIKDLPIILPDENSEFNKIINKLFSEEDCIPKEKLYTRNHQVAFQLSSLGYGAALFAMPVLNQKNSEEYRKTMHDDSFRIYQLTENLIKIPIYIVYNSENTSSYILSFVKKLHKRFE